jgi:uncharacterized protein (TIGR02246 family)
MPKPFQKLVLLAAIMLAAGPSHAQSQTAKGRHTMDHAAIQATVDANNAAVSAGNIEAALATFEPGAAMVAQPGVTVAGTAALRASFQQFLAINPKITATGHDIVQAGDIALHSFTWTMAGQSPDGSAITQTGFSTVVLRKQADGRWLMVIDNPFADLLLKKK